MPVDRQYNRIVFECDSCDEAFSGRDGEEFQEAWARAKEAGWRCRQVGNDWVRGCPDCGV
jgi:hypothetical protein